MKPIINTHYERVKTQGEINTLPSETVPDDSLSIETIMKRYANGMPLGAPIKTPVYNGEEDLIPNFDKLDLAEREEIIRNAKVELQKLKQKVQDEYQKKQEAASAAASFQAQSSKAKDEKADNGKTDGAA